MSLYLSDNKLSTELQLEFINKCNCLFDNKSNECYFLSYYKEEKLKKIKEALESYASAGHIVINKYLNLKKGEKVSEEVIENIKNLTSAMEVVEDYRLKNSFIVYRGIDVDKEHEYYKNLVQLKNKKFINNPSFLSTTYDKKIVSAFIDCCLFKIFVDVNEDLNYFYIGKKGEKEILFQHTTYFEYINEYEETYDDKKYTVFEVNLKKGSVISEYKEVKVKVYEDDEEFKNEVLSKLTKYLEDNKDLIIDYKDLFDNNDDKVVEEVLSDFNTYIQNIYPDGSTNVKKYEGEFKEEIFNKIIKYN